MADLRTTIEQIRRLADEALAQLPPVERVVRPGENLQAALDVAMGRTVRLEAGTYVGAIRIPSRTRLVGGLGVAVHADRAPALTVLPGDADVEITSVAATSTAAEVVRIGENSAAQTEASHVPAVVRLSAVTVPSHRGKRAFAIHGQDVTLEQCLAVDVWDPDGQDSQAIYVGNSPGRIRVRGGRYSAGSEVVLVGGDATRIPGLVPTDIIIEGATLFRPLAWRVDGLRRKVKNLLELKSGRQVRVRSCRLSGSWSDGQSGWGVVITPTLDGAIRQPPLPGGIVEDVAIEDTVIVNVGSILQVQARDYSSYTARPVSSLSFARCVCVADRATFGGHGQLAQMSAGPADVTFSDVTHVGDGSSTIYYYRGAVVNAIGARTPGANFGTLSVVRSRIALGAYGFNFDGRPNASDWPLAVDNLIVSENVLGGGAARLDGNGNRVPVMRAALRADQPNRWIDAGQFEAIAEVVGAREWAAELAKEV